MKRRLGTRDRIAWFVAIIGVAIAVYVLMPLWTLIVAVVAIVGVPLVVRMRRRQVSRR
jgi:hypothetical protein